MSSQDPWETHQDHSNGWQEYKSLVINELDRANNRLDIMDKRLGRMEQHITVLQTKATAWAAGLAIFISVGIGLLSKLF